MNYITKRPLKSYNTASNALTHLTRKNYATQANFSLTPCRLFKLDNGPADSTTLTKSDALKYYRSMQVMRRMEVVAGQLYQEKHIRGFLHLYNGQEAVAVGMHSCLRSQDTVITAYRCHGWTYLLGVSVLGVLAELTGKESGCSRGKGGSMHMYSPTFYGGNGIVGAQVPLGAGLAFASKYRNDGGVCLSCYGDGAANQGQVFEAFNMCKLWDVPCIFVCENNQYGMGTSASRSSASTEYYKRGDFVPGLWVDGMDVLACREACQYAIDYCTSGKGPLVIEMFTYRYQGHSMSDPGVSYRSREEIQGVREKSDPIITFKNKIIAAQLVTEQELKSVDVSVNEEVESAAERAKKDSEVKLIELSADIYAKCYETSIRGALPTDKYPHTNIAKPKNM